MSNRIQSARFQLQQAKEAEIKAEREKIYQEYKTLPSGSLASRAYYLGGTNFQHQKEIDKKFLV